MPRVKPDQTVVRVKLPRVPIAERVKARKQQRVDQGLCGRCGKEPLVPGLVLGEKCRAKVNEYQQKRTDSLLAQGLCICCGKEPLQTKYLGADCERRALRRAHDKYLRLKKAESVFINPELPPYRPHARKEETSGQ